MAITVRPADLVSDRPVLIDTLRRYLTPRATERRFEWLYVENPHGRASAWIAHDATNEAVVGVAAAFPRRLLLKGTPHKTWVLGDFCVSEQYRSLGPAVQLQRALLAAVNHTDGLAGWYDFPSKQMAAVYKRIGVMGQGTLIRMAKPLRVDRLVAKAIGHPGLARILTPVVNLGQSLNIQMKSIDSSLSIRPYTGRFDGEFSELAQETSGSFEACIERSAEYLNWRFIENPLERYECLVARRCGRLCGYAVFSCTSEDAILVDLFSLKQESIPKGLLRMLAKELWKRRVSTISVPLVEGHPWLSVFRQAGFHAREGSPFIVSPGPAYQGGIFKDPQAAWHFMHGDRDS